MSNWYCNEDWSSDIEREFFRRLNRARSQRAQYLKIQAGCLCRKKPQVALSLLDQYFSSGDPFFLAEAYLHQAHCKIELADFEGAATSFEKAVARQKEFPKFQTDAAFEFPLFVAERKMKSRYASAILVVEENRKNVLLPSNKFDSHAALALISQDLGEFERAKAFASLAIEAASLKAPFPRHPEVGLVGSKRSGILSELRLIVSKSYI